MLKQKEMFAYHKAILELVESNQITPVYLGEFDSIEAIEEEWEGVFAWFMLKDGDTLNFFANVFKLVELIAKIDTEYNLGLTSGQSEIVMDVIIKSVAVKYKETLLNENKPMQ